MRVAALYDIHGNLPALEAVLEDVRRAGVDHIVIGGDVALGPMPAETMASVLELDAAAQFIRGNCDREMLALMRGVETGAVPEAFHEVMQWSSQQLPPGHEEVLAGWPETVRVDIDGLGEVLFCHATPRDDNEIFTRLTPEDRLLPIFEAPDVPLVVCGHTHMQFDRRVGNTRVVNAGSAGMPFGEPGAYWLLLGPDVQLRHTSYDLEEAARRIRDTQYPQAEDFARDVLEPRSEAEMLEVFAAAALD